jgi:hypothetical protein
MEVAMERVLGIVKAAYLGNKYEGTANYAPGDLSHIFNIIGHYKYDMAPYFNQYPETKPWYSLMLQRILYP